MPVRKEEHKETDGLAEKYRRALETVEKTGIVSIKLKEAEGIKYRLSLRKTNKGVIHTLEIMESDASFPAVRIDLLGNWETVLESADRVLANMSMDDFREVAEQVKQLRPQQKGRRNVEEL